MATLLSNNVTAVATGAGAATQLAWGVYTLATLTAVGGCIILAGQSDAPILVGVFSWALGAVANELLDPIDAKACKEATGGRYDCNLLSEMYPTTVTNGLSGACAALSVTMLVLLVLLISRATMLACANPADAEGASSPLASKERKEPGGTDGGPSGRTLSVESQAVSVEG